MLSTPDEVVVRGRALIESHRYREAVRALDSAAKTDLANWRLQCWYAEALIQVGRFRDGLSAARLAQQMQPDSPWVLQLIGESQLALDQPGQALEAANRMIELAPHSAAGYDLRGRISVRAKRYHEAEADFRQAVSLEPNNSGLNNNLGLALRHLKRDREAVAVLEKAVSADPSSRIARHNLFGATSAYIAGGGLIGVVVIIRFVPAIGGWLHLPVSVVTALFVGAVVIALVVRWAWTRSRLHRLGVRAVAFYDRDWWREQLRGAFRYLFSALPVFVVIAAVIWAGTAGVGYLPWIVAGGVVIVVWWFAWQPAWRGLARLLGRVRP